MARFFAAYKRRRHQDSAEESASPQDDEDLPISPEEDMPVIPDEERVIDVPS